jgi:hypothetical protein
LFVVACLIMVTMALLVGALVPAGLRRGRCERADRDDERAG